MDRAFRVHRQLGRFLEEDAYRNELKRLLGKRACAEVRVDVRHADFCKTYFLDLLVDEGALFELKTASRLADRHRVQLINYLLLTGLKHGKLINFRPEEVEQEFVNTTLSHQDRIHFDVDDTQWDVAAGGGRQVRSLLLDLLRDWGTGLDVGLYQEALTHFLGGPERVRCRIDVLSDGQVIGRQSVRQASPGSIFKVTALLQDLDSFRSHARRLLAHTPLRHILWINIELHKVTFETLSKGE